MTIPDLSAEKIRGRFVDFFVKEKAHEYAHSIPLVPAGDPTLLFTNSGMVQFKGIFLGMEQRPYKRAVNSQRCLRVSGKHNDLEDVGKDTYHHTFFEMLGNWSFGDYYKAEAIEWGWNLLTRRYGIDSSRLWATVYKKDDESATLWPKIAGLPKERIWAFGEKDNFWEMGETGPCGPCSEIHYDRGKGFGCERPSCGPNCPCGRFIELWNLVFIQFNRGADGKLTELPSKHVDTGMGLERLVAVLQSKESNYDTDLFLPYLNAIGEATGLSYGESPQMDVSFRVVADHIRAVTFLLADGVVPTNEGRGYVLRRIMRRAIRHGKKLGLHEPFLYGLSGRVIDVMGGIFPEIRPQAAPIAEAIRSEEERFLETLDLGLQLVAEEIEKVKAGSKTVLAGDAVFKLYDTFGFPVDLTRTIAEEEGLRVDEEGFNQSMERQREMGKSARKSRETEGLSPEVMAGLKGLQSRFTGYRSLEGGGRVLAILKGKETLPAAKEGQTVDVVVDETPFYPLGGGQVGDRGKMIDSSFEGDVLDTLPVAAGTDRLILHRVKVVRGGVAVGQEVILKVDAPRRERTRLNHSATHLMHAALREVLGKHVRQYGSLVEPERLRFDFTHFAPLSPAQVRQIESRVQEAIRANFPVETSEMKMAEARKLGAMMFFGDKYGEVVRVLRMGEFSIELCGGTHVASTGEIGLFRLVQSGGVGAGVRRVQAVTGVGAMEEINRVTEWLNASAEKLSERDLERVPARIQSLIEERDRLMAELERVKRGTMDQEVQEAVRNSRPFPEGKAVWIWTENRTVDDLRLMVDIARSKVQSGVVVAVSHNQGASVPVVVGVTDNLRQTHPAGTVLREIAATMKGKGGGRPDFAQGAVDPKLRSEGKITYFSLLKAGVEKA